MRLLLILALTLPGVARADYFPFVTKGPVITGVTPNEAWVAWSTAHHEGTGGQCTIEAFTPFLGNHNDDVPTLTFSNGGTVTDAACSRDHKVHLTGLSPSTHYRFTLDKPYGDNASAGGEFTTGTTDPDAVFDFVVYGDNRDSEITQTHRADHQAVSDGIVSREGNAAFLLHTGDLALNLPAVSGDDRGYTEFFDVERGLLSTKPIFGVVGNHETIDTGEFDSLVNPRIFAGADHPYYWSFDWGGVHVALVDAFEGAPIAGGLAGRAAAVSDEQAQWLEDDLAAARAAGKALFVVAHQSPFSYPDPGESSGHGGSVPMQEKVLPLLVKYRALAVFGGHDHYYQRGHEGCVDYFVIGGGGAPMYEPDRTAAGVQVAKKETSYLVVTVDGTRATAIAKSATGAILDSFTFTPADGTACGAPPDEPDAGTPEVDAGTPVVDAGKPEEDVDAGTTEEPQDAGITLDSGTSPRDAGTAIVDAGTTEDPTAATGGCDCGTGAIGALAIGALVVRRKRKAV